MRAGRVAGCVCGGARGRVPLADAPGTKCYPRLLCWHSAFNEPSHDEPYTVKCSEHRYGIGK